MQDIEIGLAEECKTELLTNVYFPSKLGGKPAWLDLGELPSVAVLKCRKCSNQKSFLCQIYAPYDEEYNFHRMIYVFICRTESCFVPNENNNITVLRSQLPLHNEYYSDLPPPEDGDAVPEIFPTKVKLCSACGCQGPLRCSRCKKVFYCGVHHQRLDWPYHKLSCSTSGTIPTCKQTTRELISQILFPEWEITMNSIDMDSKINDQQPDVKEKNEMKNFQQLSASNKAGTFQNLPVSDLEKYTQGSDAVDDKYFQKFKKECEKDPFQIIRYKRGGDVLWISDPEKTVEKQLRNIPKCELCGKDRAFEYQMMPQMLNYLKDTNVDWGVIAIYTCPESCPIPKDKGYVEEFCIKQDIIND